MPERLQKGDIRKGAPRAGRWVLLGGCLLAAAGASFAPWVDRPPAALVLTAPDLAEFVKFLPEVRSGTLPVHRLLFLLPLFVVTLSLPLVVMSPRMAYALWVRRLALALVVPLALALLPPVWSPSVLLSAEFRLQTMACVLCLALVVASRWPRHLPPRPLLAFLLCLWLAAPLLALWQFWTVQAAVASAYDSPIFAGWGAWATAIGCGLMVVGGLVEVWKPGIRPGA